MSWENASSDGVSLEHLLLLCHAMIFYSGDAQMTILRMDYVNFVP